MVTRRHHTPALMSTKRLAQALLLALFLAAVLVPSHAQGPEEEVLYKEDFEENQAQGWELGKGWGIEEENANGTNYVLRGYEHYWANYTNGDWQDYKVSFRLYLREQNSVIHLNYRLGEEGRYYISFSENGSALWKQYWPDRFIGPLATSDTPYDYERWYEVGIIGEGSYIQFFVNGELELSYKDPEPLLRGTIAFETLDGSYAQVDDIVVIGPRLPQEEPDLVVFSAEKWDFSDGGQILVFLVEVANQGSAEASETLVRVIDSDHGWVGAARVPGLGPEERTTVNVQLEIPEELRGTTCTFMVEVDPEDRIKELDEENNVGMTPEIPIPRLPEQPRVMEVSPAEGRCGTELTLTILGSNFTPGTRVFIPEGVETLGIEFINSEELKVRIAIHPEARGGSRPVEVVDTEGQSAVLERAFTIICPGDATHIFVPLILAGAAVGTVGAITLMMRRHPPHPSLQPTEERIVSTGFSSQTQASEPLDPFVPLAAGRSYYFWFEVGPPVPGSIEVKPDPLMIELLPSEARLKVVLFGFEDEIEITPGGEVGEIQIMPDGKVRVVSQVERPDSVRSCSDLLDRRLFFLVHTPNKVGEFRLRCNVYYEQILIQSRLIQVRVARQPLHSPIPALRSTIEYTMSKTLNPNYLARMEPQKLSVMLNDNSDGTHCLRLFGEEDYKNDACFDAKDLETLVKHIRGALRRTSWGDEEPWTEAKGYRYGGVYNRDQLKDDLITLAIPGYRFWSKLTVQLAGVRPEVERLEKMLLKPTTLEFVIKDRTEASHLFPPAMIYDHPLDTNLNREDYRLCSSFLTALETGKPLAETSCFKGDCPSLGDLTVICPSGFWGFRHSIGNPLGSRSETNHEMLYRDFPEVTVAVFPSFRGWPSHQRALRSLVPEMIWNLAGTRLETFEKLKSTNPHLVYFYCHGGVTRDTPYIRVGTEDEMGRITPDNLDSYKIGWEYPQPLVFINGCHTTASEPRLTLQFVEKFVITCNAAGVIGTEISIFERLAGAFAQECLRRFFAGETIGDAMRGTRLKILEQGNPLGLVYNVYANASLRLKKLPSEQPQNRSNSS